MKHVGPKPESLQQTMGLVVLAEGELIGFEWPYEKAMVLEETLLHSGLQGSTS
jgi:hypothetical protein